MITSSLSWVDQPSHHLRAEGDTFTGDETPAVRQPDTRQTGRISDIDRRRELTSSAVNQSQPIPRGWYVQSIKSRRRTALKTARCRVGKAEDCDVRVRGKACDGHQCTLEFDGEVWRLKQESMAHPTFVNGDLNPYAELKPGAKLTFLDGSGFVLRHVKHGPQDSDLPQVPRWAIGAAVAVSLAVVGGLAYAAWRFFG